MPKSLSTLEIRTNLADLGLVGFARGAVAWEGDHVRLVLLPKDSKGLSKEVVAKISACLRRIGYRCVLDENERTQEAVHVDIPGLHGWQISVRVLMMVGIAVLCLDRMVVIFQ